MSVEERTFETRHPHFMLLIMTAAILVAMIFGYWFGFESGKNHVNWPHGDYSYTCGEPMEDAAQTFFDVMNVKHFRSFTLTYSCP